MTVICFCPVQTGVVTQVWMRQCCTVSVLHYSSSFKPSVWDYSVMTCTCAYDHKGAKMIWAISTQIFIAHHSLIVQFSVQHLRYIVPAFICRLNQIWHNYICFNYYNRQSNLTVELFTITFNYITLLTALISINRFQNCLVVK